MNLPPVYFVLGKNSASKYTAGQWFVATMYPLGVLPPNQGVRDRLSSQKAVYLVVSLINKLALLFIVIVDKGSLIVDQRYDEVSWKLRGYEHQNTVG